MERFSPTGHSLQHKTGPVKAPDGTAATAAQRPLLHPAHALMLQRSAGNRAVQRLVSGPVPAPAGQPAADRPRVQRLWSNPTLTSEPFTHDIVDPGTGARVPEARTRAKTVVATLGAPVDRGTGPEIPTAIRRGGMLPDLDALKYDRGHVIALELGGTNTAGNVVPMGPGFNRVVWRAKEREIRKLRKRAGGVQMEVTMGYGADPRIPDSLTVKADPLPGSTIAGLPSETIPARGPAATTDAGTAAAASAKITAAATLAAGIASGALAPTDNRGRQALSAYRAAAGVSYPTTPGPYAALDFHEDWIGRGRSTQGFSGEQRRLVLNANRLRNGGVLRSDDPNDKPYGGSTELNEGEDDAKFEARAEVDHIIPKSNAGGNFFSNARLISWKLNNKEDRVKDTTGLVDISKQGRRGRSKLPPAESSIIAAVHKLQRPKKSITKGKKSKAKTTSRANTTMTEAVLLAYVRANAPSLKAADDAALGDALKKLVKSGALTKERDGSYRPVRRYQA